MKRLTGLICLTTLACTLTACSGSTTVEGDDVTPAESVTSEASAAKDTEASTSEATRSSAPPANTGPRDQPAQEVSVAPEQSSGFSPEEEAYLQQLSERGLNIEGVEDQLTATGRTVCADDTVTRDAVAGQLVEQRRTDMDAATLGTLIADTARANLC
ncbi:DUF732 domain-containing protein [Corynebacterium sp. HMSC071B10]|uniref:DUF732 domain-containing protein n=1 Tax=Corynebacterium sp. HMSC071B10 TaxID=1739494 RepID=UPI0008A1C69C|nr:DUF732 domain-containing protein [Corynebacterium sp. HMSC071B10]OFP36426.1 hypothetical protein HMPREF2990_01090 [Corynebacterium sp. HMSC071B10]